MKLKIPLFLCTLILIVPAAQSQTSANSPWALYKVKGERLMIAFPAVPTMRTFKETTQSQKNRRRRFVRCSMSGVIYSVQLIENIKPRLTLEKFFQEQSTLSPDNLTFERDVTLDGIAGKAFVYPDGKGAVQFFATDERLYEVRAYGAPVDDPRVKSFFHYLSFKKQEGAIEVSEKVQADSIDTSTATIIKGKDADTKARLISKPEPTYTGKAKSEQITGTVILKCVFASDGTVTNIRVIQGLPGGLTEKAIEAARQIKFIPATKDGKNVSMWMQLEYNFNLY